MTQDQRTFFDASPLTENFPISFRYGYTVTKLDLSCKQCEADIPFNELRGYKVQPYDFVADIFAIAKCRCGSITPYSIRLWDNMTYSVLIGNGEWDIGTTVISRKHKLQIWLRKFKIRVLHIVGFNSRFTSRKLLPAATQQTDGV